MKVLKFGGSILKTVEDFDCMSSIITQASSSECLVVISALGTSTRDLESCCNMAIGGDLEATVQQSEKLFERLAVTASNVLKDQGSLEAYALYSESCRDQIQKFLRGISITRQLTPRVLDAVLSFGELLAMRMISLYLLEKKIVLQTVDSREIVITDSHYGSAQPRRRETHQRVMTKLLPLFERASVILMQGFVANDEEGNTTTMGRESSNLTAALMAQLLHADELVVYTDVGGIRSADPSLISTSKLISKLSYAQSYVLAVNGVKLLYPTMIEPLRAAQIPMSIRDLRHANGDYSIISAEAASRSFECVLVQHGLSLLRFGARTDRAMQSLRRQAKERLDGERVPVLYTESPSGLSIILESRFALEMTREVPEDCYMSIVEGISSICIINPNDNVRSLLSSSTAGAASTPRIIAMDWGEHDGSCHIVCFTADASGICQAVHSLFQS